MINNFSKVGLLTLALIAGCSDSTGPNDSETTPPDDFTIGSAKLDRVKTTLAHINFDESTILDRPIVPGNRLIFPLIPGNLYGRVNEQALIDVQVDSTNMTELVFDENIFTELSQPQILNLDVFDPESTIDFGLTIEPADTKFGRLGTFVWDETGQQVPTTAGFGLYDDLSDKVFYIVYFDQPATIRGSVTSPEVETRLDHDIVIPEKGFYAVGGTESRDSDGALVQTFEVIDIFGEAFFAMFE